MLAASFFTNPAITALIGAAAVAISYLGYRHTRKSDEVAQELSVATQESGTVNTVIQGLNMLVLALQADNRELRDVAEQLREEIRKLNDKVDGLRNQVRELSDRIP